jgi:hypothetical protein
LAEHSPRPTSLEGRQRLTTAEKAAALYGVRDQSNDGGHLLDAIVQGVASRRISNRESRKGFLTAPQAASLPRHDDNGIPDAKQVRWSTWPLGCRLTWFQRRSRLGGCFGSSRHIARPAQSWRVAEGSGEREQTIRLSRPAIPAGLDWAPVGRGPLVGYNTLIWAGETGRSVPRHTPAPTGPECSLLKDSCQAAKAQRRTGFACRRTFQQSPLDRRQGDDRLAVAGGSWLAVESRVSPSPWKQRAIWAGRRDAASYADQSDLC